MIERAQSLIKEYPYKGHYKLWPGPNSNTFVEHIIRYTPGVTVELPPHAIGKDFLTNSNFLQSVRPAQEYSYRFLDYWGLPLVWQKGWNLIF